MEHLRASSVLPHVKRGFVCGLLDRVASNVGLVDFPISVTDSSGLKLGRDAFAGAESEEDADATDERG